MPKRGSAKRAKAAKFNGHPKKYSKTKKQPQALTKQRQAQGSDGLRRPGPSRFKHDHDAALDDYAKNMLISDSEDDEEEKKVNDGDGTNADSDRNEGDDEELSFFALAKTFVNGVESLKGQPGQFHADETPVNTVVACSRVKVVAETARLAALKLSFATFVAEGNDTANTEDTVHPPQTQPPQPQLQPPLQHNVQPTVNVGANDMDSSVVPGASVLNFDKITSAITRFLSSSGSKLQFPTLGKTDRWKVHTVASVYHMTSTSVSSTGSKKRKQLSLQRPNLVYYPTESEIELARAEFYKKNTAVNIVNPLLPIESKSSTNANGVVGGNSSSLGPTNVGYKLLSGMGWRPGAAIGLREDGRLDPIEVIKRDRPRSGLGDTQLGVTNSNTRAVYKSFLSTTKWGRRR
eukprot:m.31677 g.31677  ORF g.31677 m.31677 type:complete len:405 (-) comp16500_c1_seq1:56-1270(-)